MCKQINFYHILGKNVSRSGKAAGPLPQQRLSSVGNQTPTAMLYCDKLFYQDQLTKKK